MDQVFIDGVGEIRLIDGIVRMDLVALSPTEKNEQGGLEPQFIQQIVMSQDAFLRMINSIGASVESLKERGVLKNNTSQVSDTVEEMPAAASSPNF